MTVGLNSATVPYLTDVADEYNIPVNLFVGIAICESGLDHKAYNPKDTDNLPAFGLWQFKARTFRENGGQNIWDWREQTKIVAKMMKSGMWLSWPTCFPKIIKELNDYNSKI